jgi:phage terminase small subunit
MPTSHPRRARPAFTERQLAFIREYQVDLNAAEAARRAGYSPENANKIAYELRNQPKIAARIETAQARRREKKQITADRVLEELGRMAFSNMSDYVQWGPEGIELRNNALLDEDQTAAVADVEPKGNGKVARLKLYDKLAALNALARHLGMIGGKTALGPSRNEDQERRDANAILRERLMRIVKQGEKETK